MTFKIRVDHNLDVPSLRQVVDDRARFALNRLRPQLHSVQVHVSRATDGLSSETVCRVSGSFSRGGNVHAVRTGDDAHDAVDSALDCFQRTVARIMGPEAAR